MPRCKNCKDKFEVSFFNQKYCSKEECKDIMIKEALEKGKKNESKAWKQKKAKLKVDLYPKKYKGELQKEINKLARNIDTYFNLLCIDCGKEYGKQADGSHYHNAGQYPAIRYNLHNIHKSRSDCNQFHGGKKSEYKQRLEQRYSKTYLERIEALKHDYNTLKLTNQEVFDKLTIVRKINREFETFNLKDPIQARNMFNKLIGIY